MTCSMVSAFCTTLALRGGSTISQTFLVALPSRMAVLSAEERTAVLNAARSAVVSSRGLSRIIEASDRGLPPLAQRMEIHVLTARELETFRKATQPAVRGLIEKRFGTEGLEILSSFENAIRTAE